jgi:hypothetical protein
LPSSPPEVWRIPIIHPADLPSDLTKCLFSVTPDRKWNSRAPEILPVVVRVRLLQYSKSQPIFAPIVTATIAVTENKL